MKCEIREASTLKRVAEKIRDLAPRKSIVGVILAGAAGWWVSEPYVSLAEEFWKQLTILCPSAYLILNSDDDLEKAIAEQLASPITPKFKPIVFRMKETDAADHAKRHALVERMRNAGCAKIVVVCITYSGEEGYPHATSLVTNVSLRDHPPTSEGIDFLVMLEGEEDIVGTINPLD